MKVIWKIVLLLFFPLGIVYLLLLRCQKRDWPEGLKEVRYAHRGLHHLPDAPENSMAAFRAAIDRGYGAELDVHLMKDGNLAVIHDSSLLRTAGVDVAIEDLTKEALEAYRLEGTEEKIPLFEEVLELFEGKTPLLVELKTVGDNHRALAEATCRLLDRYRLTYCIESFDPRALIWLKKHRPEIIRGQLSGDLRTVEGYSPFTLFVLTFLLSNGFTKPDFIAFDHRFRDVSVGLKIARRLYGVQEFSWTVKDAELAERLEKEGNLLIFEGFGKTP